MEANRAWGEGGASARTSEENAEAACTQHLRHSPVAGSQQNSPAFVHSDVGTLVQSQRVGSVVALFWSAHSKLGVGLCGLSEGSGSTVPREEGTANMCMVVILEIIPSTWHSISHFGVNDLEHSLVSYGCNSPKAESA
ncbi:hypothetical protein D8674_005466 [Pyrus ussuriensis x Pyrus communis]|uniref:Uncharacterized protein n=1 Tax=Pyrus ussuriensis x Pyrus communis TaxID=2448454 RepID=A0A5N5FRI7_9ROSA|nr:hypothetical protein D8674_005466 [Pyrus ussuriensis x Pyrus communis]